MTIIFRLTKQAVDHLSEALSFISGVFLIKIGQNFGLCIFVPLDPWTGLLVEGSGFEVIVFQSGLCTSGSLTGTLTDVHYNCGWRVHQMVCEAMERLLWERFVHEVKPAISNDIQQAAAEDADEISFETIPCSHFLLQKLHQLKGKG